MSDPFTALLNTILFPVVEVYSETLAIFPFNFFSYILASVLLGFFMQTIFGIVPWFKSIVDGIMMPFRVIHVWLHVHQASTIIKHQSNDSNNTDGTLSLRLTSYFSTGFGQKGEKPGLAISGLCSPREAASIANAPAKGAFLLLLLLTLITPLLRGTFLGTMVHLYILLGISTSSWPSTSDYSYTYNMLLANPPFSLNIVLLSPIMFTTGFVISIIITESILFAVIWGVATSSIFIWVILMLMIWKKTDSEIKNPESTVVPNGSSDSLSIDPVLVNTTTIQQNDLMYFIDLE
ncbi:MAG: hypothetical protein ACXAEU_19700 [Candidatus Hodarchaeales archaeon]|jgi:uncharacterized membrane protein YciS (DUF1049 family)